MSTRIVVSIPFPQFALKWRDAIALRIPDAEVFVDDGSATTADFAIGWKPSADFFERISGLRAFLSAAAGVDHLLEHAGMPVELPIARIEDGGMGLQMAEYCCQEVFRFAQRRSLYEQQQAQGIWQPRGRTPREDLGIGIIGMGTLGARVARMLRAFEYPVIGHASSSRDEDGIEVLGPERRDEFFSRSRILILLAPLTAATRGIVNRDSLAKMPAKSWLINVARGGLVVEQDLLDAVNDGHLLGASLDVFVTEPLPGDHPFWTHPGIRVTPHVAAITLINEGADQLAARILSWLAGAPLVGQVERARGY